EHEALGDRGGEQHLLHAADAVPPAAVAVDTDDGEFAFGFQGEHPDPVADGEFRRFGDRSVDDDLVVLGGGASLTQVDQRVAVDPVAAELRRPVGGQRFAVLADDAGAVGGDDPGGGGHPGQRAHLVDDGRRQVAGDVLAFAFVDVQLRL